MDLSVHESNRYPLIDEQYENSLTRSLQSLSAEIQKKSPNFASFTQNFFELMQASIDPPIESIWVYSALKFRARNASNDEPLARMSSVKELFQLVSACSAPCGSSKSVALLAPVVLELHRLAVGFSGKELVSKMEKKVKRGVKDLLDVVLGYASVCCCSDSNEGSHSGFVKQFGDLVSLWVSGDEGSESFLPLVSADITRVLCDGGCDVEHLAGIVIAEAFLLKLCLSFRDGVSRVELEKELRIWAVGSLTGFKNYLLLETLARMLLETSLPVTSLLGSEDEVLLRKVLFDAVILVEYSFLNPDRGTHLAADRMKVFAMAKLIVTYEAIKLLREEGDHRKAISYQNAFSSSHLPHQIIKWVSSQIGMEAEASRSYGSSPKLLLKWLLSIEDQGIRVFDDTVSKCRAKLVIDISRVEGENPASKILGEKEDADTDLFYIDNKGEGDDGDKEDETGNESMNAAFLAAARAMKSTENDGRKRKEGKSVEKKKRVKFIKYELSENSGLSRERPSPAGEEEEDGSSSGSEVENPLSDEDTES